MIAIVITSYGSAYTLSAGADPELMQHPLLDDGTIGEATGSVDFDGIPTDERDLLREVEKCLDQLDTASIAAGT